MNLGLTARSSGRRGRRGPGEPPYEPGSRSMHTNTVSLTLIDGPTLLIEFGGLRILIDQTFD